MKPIEYLVTADEMQRYDANMQEIYNVPGLLLMEQAAIVCRDIIITKFATTSKVLILAGKGNNGGDALALARLLHQKGYSVTVHIVSNSPKSMEGFSASAKVQYEILKAMDIDFVTNLGKDSYDIIIDGIFGVGLSRNIEGTIADTIESINGFQGFKIAIDIPSGIDATTGRICNVAFKADLTITFAFYKRGLFLLPGARYVGEIIKGEIGITKDSFLDKFPSMFTLTGTIYDYLPKRDSFGHKGTFGKVLIIAGSKEICGAAILAAKAAMYSGCGMIRICTHKENKNAILTALPEAMIDDYENEKTAISQLEKGMEWADVIAVGPGIGTFDISKSLLKTVIKQSTKPLVIDADGINLLADEELYFDLKEAQSKESSKRDIIFTPHPLELARICHCKKDDISNNGLKLASDLAKNLHAVIIKKDANTIITDGYKEAINLIRNSGMATAGSGDVLCGILAALLALHLPVFDTAVIGVYLHALAGDKASKNKNEVSLIASDIIHGISMVFSEEL